MPERPVNNLPPGSQPWAREIAGAIDAAQFDAIKANMNNKNAFKTINATLDQLAKQLVQIQEQQEYLASLVSREATSGSLNRNTSDGTLLNTDTWTYIAGPSVVIPSSTGKLRVMLSSDNVGVAARTPGTAVVYGGITYGYTGPTSQSPSSTNTAYMRANDLTIPNMNGPLSRFGTITSLPGTYTITAYYAYRYSGTSTGYREVNWTDLRLVVDIIGNN
jgi:hypothetical protein